MQNKILFLLITFFIIPNLLKSQTASFTVNKQDATYCFGDTVLFTNTSGSGYVYSYWRFGDGFETYVTNPKHIYEKAGTFTARLIITKSNGSKDSINKQIIINPAPVINLINNTAEQYLLVKTGITDVQFTWYLGTTKTDETDSIVYYLESGSYSVVAYNQFCRDSANIKIADSLQVDISEIVVKNNILTPDIADGANDVLFIENLDSYDFAVEIYIYNKWGQLVYKNLEYSNLGGFAGEDDNGKKLDAGTYYYVIKSKGRKGGSGFVDIIR